MFCSVVEGALVDLSTAVWGETRQRSSAAVAMGRCYPEPVLQQMTFANALQKKLHSYEH